MNKVCSSCLHCCHNTTVNDVFQIITTTSKTTGFTLLGQLRLSGITLTKADA